VVQYHTSADSAEHNRNLIKDVLIELAARDPGGLHYHVYQLDDGGGFPARRRVRRHHRPVRGLRHPNGSFTGSFGSAWRPSRLSARAVLIGSYVGSRCGDA